MMSMPVLISLTVVHGRILTAACHELEITSPDAPLQLAPTLVNGRHGEQYAFVSTIAKKIVKNYTLVKGAFVNNVDEASDTVYNYARVLCDFGVLIMEFLDAWAEW